MRPEHAKVIEAIRAAFPATPIPSEEAFTAYGAGYLDASAYREHLRGKSWRDLDPEYMGRRSDALGFLSAEILVAVLPVYLTALVEGGVWSPAAGMLTIILASPLAGKDTGLGKARFAALVEGLTGAQRVAVASALRAFAEQDEGGSLGNAASSALASHWNTYLPPED